MGITMPTCLSIRLIIELKAAKALADEHVAQILGYLRASHVEHGLLINFGAPKFEIKKYALSRIGEASSPGGFIANSSPPCVSCAFSRPIPFRLLRRSPLPAPSITDCNASWS